MNEKLFYGSPEIWGGIECTINRIGNDYKDQLEYSGHYSRPGDIEAIASLGIKTIRYPVLWEKHQPKRHMVIEWSWISQQLETIRSCGMKPVVGLLHHGSGPSFTDLLDPEFPYLLADYAYEVAGRFPWIENYTPVNEPLTTARFSGLYGLWYPHHKDELSFYRMLVNQLKGTVLSMEAIRSVNPSARLIQTEDLGKSHSTSLLAYQADFENDRRLLTFDILAGHVKPDHPHYAHMLGCGITSGELEFFQLHDIKPDIIGLNYYVTSERWLDESLEKYDPQTHGGNGIHKYADTEIVRANLPARSGFTVLAMEIWDRYRIPMAVTESHLHCTREEQLRWFKEIWDHVSDLIEKGVEINGVTAWALLGSFDWDTLLTKTGSQYESGVFDIRTPTGQLRQTALASLIKNLIDKKTSLHPVIAAPGWWQDPNKLMSSQLQPIMILKGQDRETMEEWGSAKLCTAFKDACQKRRIPVIITNHIDEADIVKSSPWAVINLDRTNRAIKWFCSVKKLQYVSFNNRQEDNNCLNIIMGKTRVNIHHIDKVLDLMIDGVEGSWTLSSCESDHKYQRLSHLYITTEVVV